MGDERATRIEVKRNGSAFDVSASADLASDARVVWETLTDYERLPQFVPGIRAAKVLERTVNGGQERLLIDQQGEFRFLFFSQKVSIRLEVTHLILQRIDAKNAEPAAGDERKPDISAFEGRYVLEPAADGRSGTRLLYRARIVPAFSMPPVIGAWAVRETIAEQFTAMVMEIERRGDSAEKSEGRVN